MTEAERIQQLDKIQALLDNDIWKAIEEIAKAKGLELELIAARPVFSVEETLKNNYYYGQRDIIAWFLSLPQAMINSVKGDENA